MLEEYRLYLQELDGKSLNTQRIYTRVLNEFFAYFKIENMADIISLKASSLRVYRQTFVEKGNSNVTINTTFNILKAFFSWLYQNEMIDENPFKRIKGLKEAKKVRDFLTDDECKQVIAAVTGQTKVVFLLALYAGLRREELANVRIGDVRDGRILVHGKGKKERLLILHPSVAQELYNHIEKRREDEEFYSNIRGREAEDHVFVSSRGGHGVTPESIRCWIKESLVAANLPPERVEVLSTHCVRHSSATRMLSAGAEIGMVQQFLGHSSQNTTRIYAHTLSSLVDGAVLGVKGL